MPFKRFGRNDSQDSRYDEDYYGRTPSDREDEGYENEGEEEKREEPRPAPRRQSFGGAGATYSMKLMKPTAYTDGTAIADELIANNAVIINLENADAETAANLIFFLDGVIYAIEGHLKPVSANTFMLAPKNMEITEAGGEPEPEEDEPSSAGSGYGYTGYGAGYRG